MSWATLALKSDLMNRVKRNPQSNYRHYCRQCDQVFDPAEEGDEPAHLAARFHVIQEHDATLEYRRCSRYCEELEQPEEQLSQRKLYGVGYDKRTSPYTRGYNDLFPDD